MLVGWEEDGADVRALRGGRHDDAAVAGLVRALGLLVGLAVGVVLLWSGVRMVGPVWAVHQGEGVRGELTVEAKRCQRSTCDHFGTFTSADGLVTLTRVNLVLGRGELGDKVRAVHLADGEGPRRAYAVDSPGLFYSVVLLFAGTLATLVPLGIFGGAVVRRVRGSSRADT